MTKQLQGWAEANKDNVSLCPMCKTRIEKSGGCNHMTCGMCNYEFCWACGESASWADDHFGFMRGCGAAMMDETVKPGSLGKRRKCCGGSRSEYCRICAKIGLVLLFILLYPFILVFYPSVMLAVIGYKIGKELWGMVGGILMVPVCFILGLLLDICWVPFFLLSTLIVIVGLVIQFLTFIGTGCKMQQRERRTWAE